MTNVNDTNRDPLDIDAVRSFVLVAELHSFTRAAQAAGVTQSAVSLKLKRLEQRLSRAAGRAIAALGAAHHARRKFSRAGPRPSAAHDRALKGPAIAEKRLTIGISDHVAGPDLPRLIARVAAFDPSLVLDIRIDFSNALLDRFDAGKLDAAIVRLEGSRRGGEKLLEDEFGWFASPAFRPTGGQKLRLAMLAAPCGVRMQAIRALNKAKIGWIETFTGGGVAAVAAAIVAGLAVSPLARRIAPPGTRDVGAAFSLPPLGRAKVVLYSNIVDARSRAALRTLAAAFRSTSAN